MTSGKPRRPARPRAPERASRSPAETSRPAGGPPTELENASSRDALRRVWLALAILLLARAALAFVPSMWAWGLNLHRFLAPAMAWAPWGLAALALVPPVARRLAPATERIGDTIAAAPLWPYAVFALAGVVVWLIPDRLYYVGDFLVRFGAAARNVPTATLFPQAQPLDLLLHHDLPRLLAGVLASDVLIAERLVGALEAAAFGALAVAFVRALELRGGAAVAAAALLLGGGYLGLFTGYGKAMRELCLLTLAVATFSAQVARSGRGHVALGATVAAGLLLHRSALVFLAPLVVAWEADRRARGLGSAGRAAAMIAGLAIPLVVLAIRAPELWNVFRTTDAVHLAPEGGGVGGMLAWAFAPRHLVDAANTLLLLSPLCALAIAVIGGRSAPPARAGEGPALAALVAPFLAALLVVHPAQGRFRDWDDFAPAAVAVSAFVAWRIGRTLARDATRSGLAAAVALAALGPAAQWLVHEHDLPSGIARVRAYLTESPVPSERDRTLTWDYLGTRLDLADSLHAAVEARAQAATLTPTPRLLYLWARAEADREHYATSRDVLKRTVARAPDWAEAWGALAFVGLQLRDTTTAREASERALELDPHDPLGAEVRSALARPR